MRGVRIALILAGCGTTPYDDVVGPFTGPTHRYTLDSIELPVSDTQARDSAGDLNGDGYVDNQLANAARWLATYNNLTSHAADMIAAGQVPTSLEVVADDLTNDPTAGVHYLGRPDAPSVVIGGRFENGSFRSNLVAYSAVPGQAELVLPVLTEANPLRVYASRVEIELEPDGRGGFDAEVHGAMPYETQLLETVYRGVTQMIASDPGEHRGMFSLLDYSPRDGEVSFHELADSGLLQVFLWPDITLEGMPAMSFGFHAHFRPCDSGPCLEALPLDHCFDRVVDGDETDIDCGGSCASCQGGAVCMVAADCATRSCDGGSCAEPTCTDGIRDGLESDVDCGGMCERCALGQRCYVNRDCASSQCGSPDDSDWDFSARQCSPYRP